jgi:hypothetical protein
VRLIVTSAGIPFEPPIDADAARLGCSVRTAAGAAVRARDAVDPSAEAPASKPAAAPAPTGNGSAAGGGGGFAARGALAAAPATVAGGGGTLAELPGLAGGEAGADVCDAPCESAAALVEAGAAGPAVGCAAGGPVGCATGPAVGCEAGASVGCVLIADFATVDGTAAAAPAALEGAAVAGGTPAG